VEQRVESLTQADRLALQRQRDWMLGHYPDGRADQYDSLGGKLILIETILRSGWIRVDETWKLQCLGVTFGDALEQYMGLEWVAVDDEYGRDIAMRDPAASTKVFPLTMISKRVEEGREFEVTRLFTDLCNDISRLRLKQ
jgi:hypothetical protein